MIISKVKVKVRKILSKPIKTYLPEGLKLCLRCGVYNFHSLVYCPGCGQKFKKVTEASLLEILPKIKSGYGIHNTANSIVTSQLLIDNKNIDKRAIIDDIIDELIKENKK